LADIPLTRTISAPLSVQYFDPSGVFAGVRLTPVRHEFVDDRFTLAREGDDETIIVDAAIGWRLPNRRGILTLEIENLFDQEFGFEERPLLGAEGELDFFGEPTFARERRVFARATLRF
jgi:hypothetical protein